MLFSVTVSDRHGARRVASAQGDSAQAVAAALRAEGLLVIAVKEKRGRGGAKRGAAAAKLARPRLRMRSFDEETGLREISSMLRSGVPLLSALQTAAEQAPSRRAARTWLSVRDSIAAGRSLADALAAEGRRFGRMEIALVRVGEKSGELDSALTHAAAHLESRRNARSLLASALSYPLVAVTAAIGVCIFLVVSVIPKIADFLESGGAELPAMTQNLVLLSAWLGGHWATLATSAAALVAALVAARAIPASRLALDAAALRLPVAGRLLRISGTATFSRALSVLVRSGVSLLDALDVCTGLMGNRRLARRVAEASEAVVGGGALAPALQARGDWMPMLSRMTAVGETTGTLDTALGEVATFHEMLLATAIRRFGAVIEPAMIVFTGIVVGYVYVAFFVALFSLAGMS